MKKAYVHIINVILFIVVLFSIAVWYFGFNFVETVYPNTINYLFLASLIVIWIIFYFIQIKHLDKLITISLCLGLLGLLFIIPGFFGPIFTHWYYGMK